MNPQVIPNRLIICLILTLGIASCDASDTNSNNTHQIGFSISDKATPTNAGLPAYPGSKPYVDPDQANSAANIGLSTPLFGLKVVAMHLETADESDRVAAFYKQALSKYGDVLECGDMTDKKKNSKSADELVCDSNEPGTFKVVYKAGTKNNQKIVAIKSHGTGTRFSLVSVDLRK